ncbi:MAG: DUF6434 domain-containing protein [Pseudomonadota bacterium]
MSDEIRPDFRTDMSAAEFQRWYWPKAELEQICERLALPRAGSKQELRERVAACLAGEPLAPAFKQPQVAPNSTVNWAKDALSSETIITPDIAFGPNVRRFFKREIGASFRCHGDFMVWVKANPGATLADAVEAWHMLEQRKQDPTFRREIASHNNYLQYLRDFQDALPERSLDEAKRCWDQKKLRPATGGQVVFERADVRFLDCAR